MTADRREFLRHPIKVPIKVRMDQKPGLLKSQTADLSEGGLGFYWEKEVTRGTLIDITIPIINRLFKITGRVAYCAKDSANQQFRIGVAFSEPVMSFRAKLAEELLRIKEFRDKTSQLLGHEISEEEAASQWIKKYAEKFAELYQV